MNIGVLNSGGDSPGLNAVIEGVVGAASRRGWNVVGFYDGFEGLLSEEGNERFEWLTPVCCRGLRAKGGTILGTVNKGNFAIKVGVDQKGAIEPAVLEKTKATIRRLGLDALIVVGGDGSQSTALLLSEIGLPVVGVPKTIDNDLGATDVTFGFYSAVSIVSESLDRLETTAQAAGVKTKAVVAQSDLVAESIMSAAKKHKCDLVVMASHGRKGIKRVLLGSETQHVLTHSTVPVLVLR